MKNLLLKSLRPLLSAACVAALSAAYVLGSEPQETELEAKPVAGKVSYVAAAFGGNLGVSVGEDGVLLIDSLFERTTESVQKALDQLSKEGPRFLVNTHTHGDHTGGNAHFAEQSTIVAHANVRARMKGEGLAGLPLVTFEEGLSLHFNGEEIRLMHVPNAHTDGDTIVWFRDSNVFHMGDCYFELGYPYIDIGRGGNVRGLIAAVRKVLDLAPKGARFIPGHGKVTGVRELEEYVEMLETLTERVASHLEAGDDVQAMLKVGVSEDFDERWGGFNFVPPQRMIEIVVASLTASDPK